MLECPTCGMPVSIDDVLAEPTACQVCGCMDVRAGAMPAAVAA